MSALKIKHWVIRLTVLLSLCWFEASHTIAAATDNPVENQSAEKPAVIVSRDPSPGSPAISVNGIVQDENGKPLPGMDVVLIAKRSKNSNFGTAHRDILARTMTGPDGRFSLDDIGIPPRMTGDIDNLRNGLVGAQLVVWGNGKALSWQDITAFRSADTIFQLLPETEVSGVVVNEDGKPVQNAELQVWGFTKSAKDIDAFFSDPGDLRLGLSELSVNATTDEEGKFNISNLPFDFRVNVFCKGKNGESSNFFLDTGTHAFETLEYRNTGKSEFNVYRSPVRLETKTKPCLSVRVLDDAGRPVSGGAVIAFATQSYAQTSLNDDGYAFLILNAPGKHSVIYSADPLAPGIGVFQKFDILDQPQTLELRLPKSKVLSGKVLDADTGEPVVGAYVQCSRSIAIDSDSEKTPTPTGSTAVSGKDGVFHLNVTPGEWKLSFTHEVDGYLVPVPRTTRRAKKTVESLNVTVTEIENPGEVTLRLARGLILKGTVVDGAGTPQPGARVTAEYYDGPWKFGVATTDNQGKFTIAGLSPHVESRVIATTDSGAAFDMIPAHPDQPWDQSIEENITLTVSVGTTLTGRVTHLGKPMANVPVKLKRAPPAKPGENSVRYSLLRTAVTDDDGRYQVSGIHKGDRYELEIPAVGNLMVRDWRYQSPYGNTNNSEDGATVDLPEALLLSNEQTLKGIVVDPDGQPVANVTVSARLASGGMLSRPQNGPSPWAETDNNGRFELTNLPDEPIALMAHIRNPAGGRIDYPSSLTVEMGATDIRITLDPRLGTGIEDLDAK